MRKNFGVLTEVPFFNNFEMNVNEIYEDSLEGTLQSFANGPIMDSYQNLVKNITNTLPEISESFYRGWILGDDYLKSNSIEYSENLKFNSCKFKEGLTFEEEDFVSISSDNKITLSEGSLSLWTINKWSGIDNDTEILFDIYNAGLKIINMKKDFDIKTVGIKVYLIESYISLLNFSEKV